jgi:hypothetical protein
MERSRELALAAVDIDVPRPIDMPLPPAPEVASDPSALGDLAVVCWKWKSAAYRVKYEAVHVNTLARMVARHYPKPHRFFCVTDDPTGLDKNVEVVPIWSEHSRVMNPNGVHLPSCYRRLKVFSREMSGVFKARRVVSLDLDVIITGDLSPLWDRPEMFVGWRVPSPCRARYSFNGSMWMTVPGIYSDIWDQFDPVKSPAMAKAAQYFGSDQGWMSYFLRDLNLPGWTSVDGVYSYPREVRPFGRLPNNARVVIFHGGRKPWESSAFKAHPWVSAHYR